MRTSEQQQPATGEKRQFRMAIAAGAAGVVVTVAWGAALVALVVWAISSVF